MHSWIDLIFGVNQTSDTETHVNKYADSCYADGYAKSAQGANKQKNEALRMQVFEYGQVPKQLFTFAHPKKKIRAQIVYQSGKGGEKTARAPSKQQLPVAVAMDDEDLRRQNSNALFHKLEKLRENFDQTESQHNLELEGPVHDQFYIDLSNSKEFDGMHFDSEDER